MGSEQLGWASFFVIFCCNIAGFVLIWSGFAKLLDPQGFRVIVQSYELFPPTMAASVARFLPGAEVGLGLTLLLTRLSVPRILTSILFGAFGIAVSFNLLRGKTQIRCGCFGSEPDERLSWTIVLRNTAGASLLAWGYFSAIEAVPVFDSIDAFLLALAALGSVTAWRLAAVLRNISQSTRELTTDR